MSSEPAISLHCVGKTYFAYGHPLQRLLYKISAGRLGMCKEFVALNDVSLDIYKGETVGVIGKNGAGKSTLLQLICGIRKPTSGQVLVKGRIAALLELGAGFQPEFTGRENIFLQGAIIGINRDEMEHRFHAIANFADIGEYIDQPVKTYSSGMFVRLAFAVATAVDAEIIIIDEAMAVGDIAFQDRCFNRIKNLKEKGATILLVSHSMPQILNNSDRVLLIDDGKVAAYTNDVKLAVAMYESKLRNTGQAKKIPNTKNFSDEPDETDHRANELYTHAQLKLSAAEQIRTDLHEHRFGTHEAIVSTIQIFQDGVKTTSLIAGKKIILQFIINSSRQFANVVLGVSIRLPGTSDLWGDNNLLAGQPLTLQAGKNRIEYTFNLPFSNGEYLVFCGLATYDSGTRIELDQRWPVEKITAISERIQAGCVHAPVSVSFEA